MVMVQLIIMRVTRLLGSDLSTLGERNEKEITRDRGMQFCVVSYYFIIHKIYCAFHIRFHSNNRNFKNRSLQTAKVISNELNSKNYFEKNIQNFTIPSFVSLH